MRKMLSMLLSNSLKTGLRNNLFDQIRFLSPLIFLCFNALLLFSQDGSRASLYFTNYENQILITLHTDFLDEPRLKETILKSGKSEISLRFRIRMTQGEQGLSLPRIEEIHIRKTGFRDLITGDFVLLINGREAGSFRDWSSFYREFSELNAFPAGQPHLAGEVPEVQYRMEVIYRKFVAPLNLLYLLPGKYISRGMWETIPWERNE